MTLQAMHVPTQRSAHPPTPCPLWCNPESHVDGTGYLIHHSDPRVWEVPGNSPRFELSAERHDELGAPWPDNIGQTDFAVRVTPLPGAVDTDGWLMPDQVCLLAVWLFRQAAEIDPHGLNGEPPEWSVRQAAGGPTLPTTSG